MEEKINYSFIIPHKNCPDLLRRCVDSIPQRDDIQIIVVDDNSDENQKPNLDRKDVEVISLDAEHSKGAGRARNIGLDHANGKWLLFADADDYFVEGFVKVLDEHKDSDVDILFFTSTAIVEETQESAPSRTSYVDNYIHQRQFERLRYQHYVPWSKMIRASLVYDNQIRFDEVEVANDMMFSLKTGHYARKILGVLKPIYISSIRKDSLYFKTTESRLETRYLVLVDANRSLIEYGKWKYKPNLLKSVRQFKQFSKESYQKHLRNVWNEEPWYAYLFDLIRLCK